MTTPAPGRREFGLYPATGAVFTLVWALRTGRRGAASPGPAFSSPPAGSAWGRCCWSLPPARLGITTSERLFSLSSVVSYSPKHGAPHLPGGSHLLLTRLGFRGSSVCGFVCGWPQSLESSSDSHCSFPVLHILVVFSEVTRTPGLLNLSAALQISSGCRLRRRAVTKYWQKSGPKLLKP